MRIGYARASDDRTAQTSMHLDKSEKYQKSTRPIIRNAGIAHILGVEDLQSERGTREKDVATVKVSNLP